MIGDLFALKTRADVKKKHKKELGFTLTAEDLGKYMEDIEAANASFVLVAKNTEAGGGSAGAHSPKDTGSKGSGIVDMDDPDLEQLRRRPR